MKKILVTGGSGFIGSHIAVLLIENGYEVIIVDSLINSSINSVAKIKKLLKEICPKNEKNLKFFKGDILDSEFLKNVFLDAKNSNKPINAVIHLAGLKSVNDSIINPLKFWEVNLNGTINLINIMSHFGCNKIVFSSSATVYKKSNELIKENCEINPINPYGQTKAAVERLLNDLYNCPSQNWAITSLRYFNPIGAHYSGMIGEDPKGMPSNIFPLINKVALGELSEIKIFGNDWDTYDGTCIRDYIHVMDLADGHISALKHLFDKKKYKLTLNLGTGLGTSVLDLITKFQEVNNIQIPFSYSKRREGDTSKVVADNKLAKKILNWSPKKNIKEMCRDGWRWQSLNP